MNETEMILQHYEWSISRQDLKYGEYENLQIAVQETTEGYEVEERFQQPLLALLSRMYQEQLSQECEEKQEMPEVLQ